MMRLVFAGTPAIAATVLDHLSGHHDIQAVLTQPPARQGRGARLVASPVQQWAERHRIEVLAPADLAGAEAAERLRQIGPDCAVVVAYGQLVPAALLEIPVHGWINLHFSALPAYRGAAPVQRALLDGCRQTGVTIFRLVPALDAGPIFAQLTIGIAADETAGDLLERLAESGGEAMVETLRRIERGDQPYRQPSEGISLAAKLDPAEARLDLRQSAQQVVNRVRAMSPQPGAWAWLGSKRFKILRAIIAVDDAVPLDRECGPGQLWATKRALFCRTGDAWIELIQIQAEGRKPMSGADWARGGWQWGISLG